MATPVPLRLTVCGLLLALSVKLNTAVRLPTADGVNVTLTVQLLVGVIVWPEQVSAVLVKSAAFVPVIESEVMTRLAPPVLITVSVSAELVVFII